MTDSDSSPFEIDSKGCRVNSLSKVSTKSNGSFQRQSKQSRNQGSSSSVSQSIDIDSLVFLSSSQVVWDVTRMFDSEKKKLVESIGFGGLLQLPNIISNDKSFSIWLLRNLKWFTGSLCVGEDINLILESEHTGKIIGLNHTGIDVSNKAFESSADKLAFQSTRLSFYAQKMTLFKQLSPLCRLHYLKQCLNHTVTISRLLLSFLLWVVSLPLVRTFLREILIFGELSKYLVQSAGTTGAIMYCQTSLNLLAYSIGTQYATRRYLL